MQYQNKRAASMCRAFLQGTYALLGILVVLAFFGDFGALNKLAFPLLGFFSLVVLITGCGGLCELDLAAEDRYVEVRCCPVLASKGRESAYSVDTDKLLCFSCTDFLCFHFLKFSYIRHNGAERNVRVGLTLMSNKRRTQFLNSMQQALEHKRNNNNSSK